MTTAPRLGLRATRLWPTDWLLGRVIIHQMLCPWWGASCTWPSHRQSTRRLEERDLCRCEVVQVSFILSDLTSCGGASFYVT
eukprot:1159388-Pelagomonas_calceolata.AAC.20